MLYTYPKPDLEAFISGNDTICTNDSHEGEVKVFFNSGNPPFSFVYAINGSPQPTVTTTVNPHIIYTRTEGTYTLISFSDANENGWISGSAQITINQAPTASFTTNADTVSTLLPTVEITNQSEGDIISWQWNFGDNSNNIYTENPIHTYKDSVGIYQINLIITDILGCADTISKNLWISNQYWMYIPNSFTPDYDGVNDFFCIKYNGIRENTFFFNIYDRASKLVYSTKNIYDLECLLNTNGWDGTHYKTGKLLPLGTYIYEINYQDFQGWKYNKNGHIFIIR